MSNAQSNCNGTALRHSTTEAVKKHFGDVPVGTLLLCFRITYLDAYYWRGHFKRRTLAGIGANDMTTSSRGCSTRSHAATPCPRYGRASLLPCLRRGDGLNTPSALRGELTGLLGIVLEAPLTQLRHAVYERQLPPSKGTFELIRPATVWSEPKQFEIDEDASFTLEPKAGHLFRTVQILWRVSRHT
ncbi:hypothetical protein M011DRAFT_320409 [Sporormia fimetaria CBS 119925]|uniref:Uncharacterized protein n=1 Tax=Sporormia fimetaria CBS 119925 TaxID=1340428 RepID=A0A6A6VEB9_9PLEO|nr:hypothetical protein M011DRAFT_320409 [Sporormia fimetaria CBS 119925]